MPKKTFYALVHREADLFVAFCPEVGTVSEGSTPEEAVCNLQEATELYLQDFSGHVIEGPVFLTTFEAEFPDPA